MNMIERVAKGIAQDYYMRRFKLPADNDLMTIELKGNWQLWANEAKAAIAAMREPDLKMIEAGDTAIETYRASVLAWRAMIDVALTEEKK